MTPTVSHAFSIHKQKIVHNVNCFAGIIIELPSELIYNNIHMILIKPLRKYYVERSCNSAAQDKLSR